MEDKAKELGFENHPLYQFLKSTIPNQQAQSQEVPKKVEYSWEFVKEVSTIPSKITEKDLVVYKTISIKNNGNTEWPKSLTLSSNSEIKGQTTKLMTLAAGKEMSAILIIDSPRKPGKYTSTWVASYLSDSGEKVVLGEPITLNFEIEEPKKEETPKEEPKKEEPKEEPKKEEPKKERSEQAKVLAAQMMEIFPGANKEVIFEFIENAPNATLEELIDSFLSS